MAPSSGFALLLRVSKCISRLHVWSSRPTCHSLITGFHPFLRRKLIWSLFYTSELMEARNLIQTRPEAGDRTGRLLAVRATTSGMSVSLWNDGLTARAQTVCWLGSVAAAARAPGPGGGDHCYTVGAVLTDHTTCRETHTDWAMRTSVPQAVCAPESRLAPIRACLVSVSEEGRL